MAKTCFFDARMLQEHTRMYYQLTTKERVYFGRELFLNIPSILSASKCSEAPCGRGRRAAVLAGKGVLLPWRAAYALQGVEVIHTVAHPPAAFWAAASLGESNELKPCRPAYQAHNSPSIPMPCAVSATAINGRLMLIK